MAKRREQGPSELPGNPPEGGAPSPLSGDAPLHDQITARQYMSRMWSFTETMVGAHLTSTLGRAGLQPTEARSRLHDVFKQVRDMWETTEADEVSVALDRTTFPIPPSQPADLKELGVTPDMLQRAKEIARPVQPDDSPEARQQRDQALKKAVDLRPDLFGIVPAEKINIEDERQRMRRDDATREQGLYDALVQGMETVLDDQTAADSLAGLATQAELLSGETVVSRFRGRAWITSGQDDGTFLSDKPNIEYEALVDQPGAEDDALVERTQFGIESLFPKRWNESEIVYNISVTATKVTPSWQEEMTREVVVEPLKLSGEDQGLLREMIGTESRRHGDYYVRALYRGQPAEAGIWWLASATVGVPKEVAIKDLMASHELSEKEATAAWLFCNAFPQRAAELKNERTTDRLNIIVSGEQEDPDDFFKPQK